MAIECMKDVDNSTDGVIINISSIAALRALPYGQYYGPSKQAVIGYTRSKGVSNLLISSINKLCFLEIIMSGLL